MGTITSFAISLEHGPPNEQQSGPEGRAGPGWYTQKDLPFGKRNQSFSYIGSQLLISTSLKFNIFP